MKRSEETSRGLIDRKGVKDIRAAVFFCVCGCFCFCFVFFSLFVLVSLDFWPCLSQGPTFESHCSENTWVSHFYGYSYLAKQSVWIVASWTRPDCVAKVSNTSRGNLFLFHIGKERTNMAASSAQIRSTNKRWTPLSLSLSLSVEDLKRGAVSSQGFVWIFFNAP